MRAGSTGAALRVPVVVERPVDTPDGAGGVTRNWQPVASLWARIEPTGGREGWFAMQRTATVPHRIYVRYREDITADMRVVAGARVFTIRAAFDPDGTRELLEILAELGDVPHGD